MKRGIMIVGVLILAAAKMAAQQDNIWTLEDCIKYALEKNIQVRKSELTNQRNLIYAGQAKTQRFPSVNASVNHNYNWSKSNSTGESGFSGTNGSNISLNSGVTLFNASKLTNQIVQSDLEVQSGLYSLETTKEAISLTILDSYL